MASPCSVVLRVEAAPSLLQLHIQVCFLEGLEGNTQWAASQARGEALLLSLAPTTMRTEPRSTQESSRGSPRGTPGDQPAQPGTLGSCGLMFSLARRAETESAADETICWSGLGPFPAVLLTENRDLE